jgi:hypothetical protein
MGEAEADARWVGSSGNNGVVGALGRLERAVGAGLALYAAMCAAPVVCLKLMMAALAAWARYNGRRSRGLPPLDPGRQCERYGATLRRLAGDHERLMTGNAPAKAARLRAVEMAYDDTLRQACAAMQLQDPPRPLDAVTRIQIEADLVTHGMNW